MTLSNPGASQVLGRDNLVSVLPQDTARITGALLRDRMTNVSQKPSHVAGLGNDAIGCGAKPEYAAGLGFSECAVLCAFWRIKIEVKPIQNATHFLNLPQIPKVRLIIPNIEGDTENPLVASGRSLPDVGFKSDVHVRILRGAQTFLRDIKTELGWTEPAARFRSNFSRWSLRRKTYQSQDIGLVCAGVFQ